MQLPPELIDRTLTVKELSELTGVHPNRIREGVKQGLIDTEPDERYLNRYKVIVNKKLKTFDPSKVFKINYGGGAMLAFITDRTYNNW